jgi:hypothetical protein
VIREMILLAVASRRNFQGETLKPLDIHLYLSPIERARSNLGHIGFLSSQRRKPGFSSQEAGRSTLDLDSIFWIYAFSKD